MDALLLALALGREPERLDPRAAAYALPFGALAVPAEALPPPRRAQRLLAEQRLPLAERVAAALAWGEAEAVWTLLLARPEGVLGDPALERVLAAWARAEAERLGVDPRAPLAGLDAQGRPRAALPEERAALADAQELLAPLGWPRWQGPLILVPWGVAHPLLAPGQARRLRPALPALRRDDGAGRAELAAAMAELALALAAEPPAGWPAWLRLGVMEAARARAQGTGLAERRLAELRAAAGAPAIAALLEGAEAPPRELALAVVGSLLHPARHRRFPALLARLRAGDDGASALVAAYGLDAAALAGPLVMPR